MVESLQGSIYLGPTTNFQGSCKLISLITGRVINRNKFTPLSIPPYVIKQVGRIAIKEDCDEDVIFTDIFGITLEVYNDDVNTHVVATGVDNNYNNYNRKDTAYKDGTNNKEYGTTHEDGSGSNATYEEGIIYTKNPPENYKQDMMDNNASDKTPGMGASREK